MIKRLLILGVFALAAGATVRVMTAPAPASATPADALTSRPEQTGGMIAPISPTTLTNAGGPNTDNRPHWQSLWTRATPRAECISLSGDGQSVAWVDETGSVRRVLVETGKTLWQTPPLPGINRVLAVPGENGGVMAYGYLNPVKPTLRLLDAHGGVAHARTFAVDGAVWNVQASPDGKNVVVGTGKSFLYVLPVAAPPPLPVSRPVAAPGVKMPAVVPVVAAQKPPVKMQVQGIPGDFDIALRDPVTLAGTWQQSGVSVWGLDGTPKWRHSDFEPDRIYHVHLSADGSVAVATSTKGPDQKEARLHLWDARTGQFLWSTPLDAAYPKALVSANGNLIAVTYARVNENEPGASSDPNNQERKLALFDRTGKRRFSDKGGLFFAPELVALSSDGTRLTVRDKSGYFYTLDDRGHMVGRVRLPLDPDTGLPPTIRETQTSRDGKTLLIVRGDGQMTLLQSAP